MIEIPKKEPLNIVPFIDIMLVLLAMVLSISTFIAKGEITVALPKSQTAGAPGSRIRRSCRWTKPARFSGRARPSTGPRSTSGSRRLPVKSALFCASTRTPVSTISSK